MTQFFEEFWTRYPRKIGKGAARPKYARALRLATHEDIMEGLERFIVAQPWEGNIKFCPYPATWLFQERWEDEHEEDNPVVHMTFDERREHSQMLLGNIVAMKGRK